MNALNCTSSGEGTTIKWSTYVNSKLDNNQNLEVLRRIISDKAEWAHALACEITHPDKFTYIDQAEHTRLENPEIWTRQNRMTAAAYKDYVRDQPDEFVQDLLDEILY